MISDNQSVVEDALSEIAHPLSYSEASSMASFAEPVKLYDQWQSLPGAVPHHKYIKATMFDPKILPFMHILDVIPAGVDGNDTGDVDFQFRLFGTGARNHYGKEGTSKRLSHMSHDGSGSGFDSTPTTNNNFSSLRDLTDNFAVSTWEFGQSQGFLSWSQDAVGVVDIGGDNSALWLGLFHEGDERPPTQSELPDSGSSCD